MIDTPFWLTDIKVLYEKESLFEIYPSRRFNIIRKLNALMRLSIYFSLIVFLIDTEKNINYLSIPFITGLITWFCWKKYKETYINTIKQTSMNDEIKDATLLNDLQTECRIPTKDNPFMNPNISEYGSNMKIPKSCASYNNKGIQRRVDDLFNEDLYRDVTDVFNKNNSQRQYYTVPGNRVPNDQGAYAQWLYGTPPSCKEGNQIACLSLNQGGNNSKD